MSKKPSNGAVRGKPVEAAAVEQPAPHDELDLKDFPGFETVFTETRDQIIRQPGRMDALDNKTGIIAGFDGLIITAAVGLMPDLLTKPATAGIWQPWVYRIPVAVLTTGLFAVFISFRYAIKAYRVRTYNEIINPREAYKQWLNRSESKTRLQLLHNMIENSENNEAALNDKAESIKKATSCLLVGVGIFFFAAVLFVIFNF